MNEQTYLARLEGATRMLAECRTVEDFKKLRDVAQAIKDYAKAQSLGLEAINHAGEIKLRSERRLGEILAEMEDIRPGREPAEMSQRVTLPSLGVSRMQSSRWQKEAAIPAPVFEAHIADTRQKGEELTTGGLLRVAQQLDREQRKVDTPPLPASTFDVILADPPWEYRNSGGLPGQAENHYSTMAMADILGLQLPAADNSVLFLWVTNPMLREGLELASTWGFEYKSNVVWVKTSLTKPGVGFYVRGRHELLFICTRGSMVPDQKGKTPIGSVLMADIQAHSQKPDEVYDLIESLYPEGTYLELFARRSRPRWTAWGADSKADVAGIATD